MKLSFFYPHALRTLVLGVPNIYLVRHPSLPFADKFVAKSPEDEADLVREATRQQADPKCCKVEARDHRKPHQTESVQLYSTSG